MGNPFVIGFGMKPSQYVPRTLQREEVINAFNNDSAVTPAYLIVGVRGSGKTVMLDEISEKIGSGWIVINLNSYADLLQSLASKLYYHKELKKIFTQKKFGFAFKGFEASIEESAPPPDYETIIEAMLEEVKRRSEKLLIVIDEVENTEAMRKFASAFQIFIREKHPVRLLMAALPENIYGLSSERKSTFLLRTPQVMMDPLNYAMLVQMYRKTLRVPGETAEHLARLTKGYSFAFQALGHVCWGKTIRPDDESFLDILSEYDYYLQEYSYKRIWEELSVNDRKVVEAIADPDTGSKVKALRENLGMSSNEFTVYRERLKRRGIIDTSNYGAITFSLPRFSEFVWCMQRGY